MWIGVTLKVKPLTWDHKSSSGLPRIWGVTSGSSFKADKLTEIGNRPINSGIKP